MAEVYAVDQDGDNITVTCTVGERSHRIVLHAESKPTHASERSYAELSDAEIIELERPSFAEFLAQAVKP